MIPHGGPNPIAREDELLAECIFVRKRKVQSLGHTLAVRWIGMQVQECGEVMEEERCSKRG